ncbi:Gfo/Idh/MocA family protein [Algisphaera agarilytica]|uniref:Putative dehydrogenase n=1 Tax=Algisphaera agarilytica TaxID=1385975 RepID=A0A7X0H365_9BACT|nr:Gfo/Idh/MocA family oxidoreductase [Algisphaera agarilytica]MBB6428426.1 putative dehydrogenase [Algisphaera agarilytica]
MPRPLNIGLIGSKFMGRTHSNAYLKAAKFFDLPRLPIMHTIAARNLEETQAFADRWGWHNASDDWKAMVNNPEIDLIDIGTPNHVHHDQALAALEAGKHVACEKPLANTLDAAREMVQAAKKAKKQKTFVWYNYRRCPALALAHQLVKDGKLGRIYHVRGFYLQDWAGPDTPMLWRFSGKEAGSGSLGDLCAHSIDAARFVTGDEFANVNGAILKTFIKERTVLEGGAGGEISGRGAKTKKAKKAKSTVDDAALFTAEFKGGAVATFEATRLSTGDKNGNKLEVHGEKGAIKFNFERMCELEWYDATLPEREQGWSTINVSNGDAGHPYAEAWWPTAHSIGYEHGFINQAADMVKAVSNRKPLVPIPDFADAYETQRVLEAVVQSAKHRTPVKLSEIK